MFSTPAKTLQCVKLEKEDCPGINGVLENTPFINNRCGKKTFEKVTRSRSVVCEKTFEEVTRSRSSVPEKRMERKPRRSSSVVSANNPAGRSVVHVKELEKALIRERAAREELERRLRELEISVGMFRG